MKVESPYSEARMAFVKFGALLVELVVLGLAVSRLWAVMGWQPRVDWLTAVGAGWIFHFITRRVRL